MDFNDQLDFDTWECVEELCCTDGPVCPHCDYRNHPNVCGVFNTAMCKKCGRPFKYDVRRTPLGKAWVTRKEGGVP